MNRLGIAVCAGVTLFAAPVTAKDAANFVDGIYATEKGCKQLEKLSEGTKRSLETVPEVLTKDGFEGWEFSCEFTKVFKHDQSSWLGLMLCQEGAKIGAATMVFVKRRDGAFEVFTQGEDEPDVFQLCARPVDATPAGKPKP